MNRYYRIAGMLCAVLIWLTACRKHDGVKTISNYSFTNTLSSRITFDIYASKEDYSNNRNIIGKHFIEPGGTISIPFEAPATYWVDWYTSDYSYNNWGPDTVSVRGSVSSEAFPRPRLDIASEPDNIRVIGRQRDTAMSVLLNGNGTSSTWQVMVSDIPELNGTHTFVFKKDFSGRHTYAGASGEHAADDFKYAVHTIYLSATSQILVINTYDVQKAQVMTFYFRENTQSGSYSRDTLEAYFYQSGWSGTYSAVRAIAVMNSSRQPGRHKAVFWVSKPVDPAKIIQS